MKKISIVIPAYNEEGDLIPVYQRIKSVFENMQGYSFEIIFVNDGSVMLHEETETLREKYGKSIDAIFREEFRC